MAKGNGNGRAVTKQDNQKFAVLEVDALKETVLGINKRPRAMIKELQRKLTNLSDVIDGRERVFLAAIEQHRDLAAESENEIACCGARMDALGDAFLAAMEPTPKLPAESQEGPTDITDEMTAQIKEAVVARLTDDSNETKEP